MNGLNDTTRTYPRTLKDAFPKDYVNEDIIEGPYHDPLIGNPVLAMAWLAVVIVCFLV